jgi:hypothetical protein
MEQKKAIITGEILKTKARQLWEALPQYNDVGMPKWSNGWLEGFKTRYKIREYVQHAEAGSAATSDLNNIAQMEEYDSSVKSMNSVISLIWTKPA